MTELDFLKFRDNLLADAFNITMAKGKDYTKGSEDVLRNFKETGSDLGIEPLKVWGIFAKKHWDAIVAYLKGKTESEPIRGRIIDLINYLVLLECLIAEQEMSSNLDK